MVVEGLAAQTCERGRTQARLRTHRARPPQRRCTASERGDRETTAPERAPLSPGGDVPAVDRAKPRSVCKSGPGPRGQRGDRHGKEPDARGSTRVGTARLRGVRARSSRRRYKGPGAPPLRPSATPPPPPAARGPATCGGARPRWESWGCDENGAGTRGVRPSQQRPARGLELRPAGWGLPNGPRPRRAARRTGLGGGPPRLRELLVHPSTRPQSKTPRLGASVGRVPTSKVKATWVPAGNPVR